MTRLELLTFLLFLTTITISYGLNYNKKKHHTLEDFNDLPDLTYAKENLPYQRSLHAKRMALDENTRSRESWGQMGQMTQYYPNPAPYTPNTNYYRNMPVGQNNNNFFTTNAPPSNNDGMVNMYKKEQFDNHQNYEQPAMVVQKPKISRKLPKGQTAVETYDYERVGMLSNDKKVKILICRLQQEHTH